MAITLCCKADHKTVFHDCEMIAEEHGLELKFTETDNYSQYQLRDPKTDSKISANLYLTGKFLLQSYAKATNHPGFQAIILCWFRHSESAEPALTSSLASLVPLVEPSSSPPPTTAPTTRRNSRKRIPKRTENNAPDTNRPKPNTAPPRPAPPPTPRVIEVPRPSPRGEPRWADLDDHSSDDGYDRDSEYLRATMPVLNALATRGSIANLDTKLRSVQSALAKQHMEHSTDIARILTLMTAMSTQLETLTLIATETSTQATTTAHPTAYVEPDRERYKAVLKVENNFNARNEAMNRILCDALARRLTAANPALEGKVIGWRVMGSTQLLLIFFKDQECLDFALTITLDVGVTLEAYRGGGRRNNNNRNNRNTHRGGHGGDERKSLAPPIDRKFNLL